MKPKYCLPIIKPTKSEVLATIENSLNDYDFFEVWLDYIEDLDESLVSELIGKLGERLIVVFRAKNGETARLYAQDRLQYISQLSSSAVLVDLDINEQAEELKAISERIQRPQTIVSYHNYQETPTDSELQDIIQKILSHQPTILKLSTLCQSEMDAVRLLKLLLEIKETGQKCIILGMGKHGAITRIFGTLWGNEMIFAPQTSKEESAPNQLTRSQLETILNIVNL